jgi:hypothetical protein
MGNLISYIGRVKSRIPIIIILIIVLCNQCEKGANSLLHIEDQVPEQFCPNGGITLYTGLDINENGILDESEFTDTSYLCHGSNSLIISEIEPKGQICEAGGYVLYSGIDLNSDGSLSDNEIQDTMYVCNDISAFQLIIGDPTIENLVHTDIEPDIVYYGFYIKDSLILDCDKDLTDDFIISIYTDWMMGGLLLHVSRVKISSLHADAFISCDALKNPIIYQENDKLALHNNWKNGELILVKKMWSNCFEIDSNQVECYYTTTGIWDEIFDSYIGIRLHDNQLGWIKVDVAPTVLKIYEYAISD